MSHRRLTDDWRRSFEKVDRFNNLREDGGRTDATTGGTDCCFGRAELRTTQQANAELTQGLTEQREIAETAQLRADRRGRAEMQDFAQMTAEMVAVRGPEGQGGEAFWGERWNALITLKEENSRMWTPGCFKCGNT